jgi:periplasmic protein TonB
MKANLVTLLYIFAAMLHAVGQESNNERFIAVEQTATFPGGINKFYDHIYSNFKYPKDVNKRKVTGTAYIEFFINEDGSIDKDSIRAVPVSELEKKLPPRFNGTQHKIIDVPESYKQEAIRVILTSPRWNPGTIRGIPNRQRFTLPLKFGK